MKERLLLVSFFVALTLFASILCAIQTAFWHPLLPGIPAPSLWIATLLYIALYRSTLAAAIFSYLCSLSLLAMTSMSEPAFLLSCLFVVLTAQSFKRRIYWSSTSYTMMLAAIGSLVFDISHWVIDSARIRNVWIWPEFIDWILRAAITPLGAPLVFLACRALERWLQQEQPIEFTAEVS